MQEVSRKDYETVSAVITDNGDLFLLSEKIIHSREWWMSALRYGHAVVYAYLVRTIDSINIPARMLEVNSEKLAAGRNWKSKKEYSAVQDLKKSLLSNTDKPFHSQ